MKRLFIILSFLLYGVTFSQVNSNVLTLEEYLGYVKKYHPVVKQAQLITSESEIKLLKSRGAFDPKLAIDYSRKKFKNTTYYDKLNASFKIPTWYGVQFKANYENNDGIYLNPEYKTPEDGLYSLGVSVSLAKGLLTNNRMVTLKQAKLYVKQAEATQKIAVNEILYTAITSYFNWLKNYQATSIYSDYMLNAEQRFQNVKRSYTEGDKPAVDTLEASINYKSRMLDLEKAKIGYIKSKLELSNYLWLENNLPLELEQNMIPDSLTITKIDLVLNSSILNIDDELIENNPKLQALQLKKEGLILDKRLKTNNLLPKVDLEYNFLSSDYEDTETFNTSNYKTGLNMSFPLFLRKERGDLKLAKLKLQDIEFDISANRVSIKNKIQSTMQEIESYTKQYNILLDLVSDYKQLVNKEERKFTLGEGSLFLVNYREVKLIESQLKKTESEYKLFNSKSNLLRILNEL